MEQEEPDASVAMKVAKWLVGLDLGTVKYIDIKPVVVHLNGEQYYGAEYTTVHQVGPNNRSVYLVGDLPKCKKKYKTCIFELGKRDWFIAGYYVCCRLLCLLPVWRHR